MAAEDIVTFIYKYGDHMWQIPRDATHLIIHESLTVIRPGEFWEHPNVVELICHLGVKKIQGSAFHNCPRLKRLIIPGVEVVEAGAFLQCEAVNYVECDKLEIVEQAAFHSCKSLRNINLPSAKDVQLGAFIFCEALTDVKFGQHLESIRAEAFARCSSLESITIPLKNGLFTNDNIFRECGNLKSVDLVEQQALHETIDSLLWEEWRIDMNEEVASINHILPNARAGDPDLNDAGRKAIAIREWIEHVLRKIIDYKAQHRTLVNEAASMLVHALPNDIVTNRILPFLALPSHTFEGEEV